MKILITGGGGLIGQAIAKEYVAHGCDVFIYDNRSNPFNDYQGLCGRDVSDHDLEQLIRKEAFDVISHQAAFVGVGESQYNIEKYVHNNVTFTAHLLNIITRTRAFPATFVLAGSMGPFGEGPYSCKDHGTVYPRRNAPGDPRCPKCAHQITPLAIDEDCERHPKSFYGLTKLAQEELVRIYAETYGVSGIALRYFSVYGNTCNPNNPYTGVLSIIANKIINSDSVSLYEDGEQTRDLISANDIASAHYAVHSREAQQPTFDTFNVGTGVSTSMGYIAREMIRQLSPAKPLMFDGSYRSGDIRHSKASIGKLTGATDWRPSVTIAEAINSYCAFIRAHWDEFRTPVDSTSIETGKLKERGLL